MHVYSDLPAVIPWWTVNGRVTQHEALRQLDDLRGKGIREFFIYPNYGLEKPDFLSEEWFDFIAFLLRECPRRQMRFWLYDELSWPSGTAGGRLCRDFPQYRMRTLKRTQRELQPGETWRPDDRAEYLWAGLFDKAASPTEISTKHECRNESTVARRLVTLEKRLVDDCFFSAMGTSGTWNQPGILDALNPAAVRAWMGYNYEPYRNRFPEALGNTIRGFFFDEPAMVSPFHTGDAPWTPGLEQAFEERYGYDCRRRYWALFEPAPGFEQFRYDYWRLVTDRFANAFTAQLAEWCDQNGLMLSGHCWPEEPSCQRLMNTATGDTYALQRHLHLPGTDFLYNENCFAEHAAMCPDTPGWARNLIYAAKLPVSAARYNHTRHSICESSGIAELGDGPVTPAAQKTALDFLAAMGITVMNPARPYDLADFRKHVAAAEVAQPYWKLYATFNEYLERLAGFNTRGKHEAKIAVLNPRSTKFALTDLAPDTSIRLEKTTLPQHADCAEPMLATLDELVRGHHDFELIFEEVLHTDAQDFSLIILPQCYALDDLAWTELENFAVQGGRLLVIGEPPTLPLRHDQSPRVTRPLNAPALDHARPDFRTRLAAELRAAAPPQYTIDGHGAEGILAQFRREQGGWQGLLLVNATPGEKVLTIDGPAARRMTCVIDQSGRRFRYTTQRTLRLPETQSLLLTTDDPPGEAPDFAAAPHATMTLPEDGWMLCGELRNVARIQLECLLDGQFHPLADNGAAEFTLDPEVTPYVTLRGTFAIQGTAVPDNLRLWLDCEECRDLQVNGIKVNELKNEKLIDGKNLAIPIAGCCCTGVNTLTIDIALSRWMTWRYGIRRHFGELLNGCTPPLLLGSFRVTAPHTIEAFFGPLSCGPLEPQGFPQFCDELQAALVFDCPIPPAQDIWLEPAPSLLPLAAELNGVNLGVRLWQNGALQIPRDTLRKHGNRLVLKLYGDLWNALGRRWVGQPVRHTPFLLPEIRLNC